jgi:hypothetical protein
MVIPGPHTGGPCSPWASFREGGGGIGASAHWACGEPTAGSVEGSGPTQRQRDGSESGEGGDGAHPELCHLQSIHRSSTGKKSDPHSIPEPKVNHIEFRVRVSDTPHRSRPGAVTCVQWWGTSDRPTERAGSDAPFVDTSGVRFKTRTENCTPPDRRPLPLPAPPRSWPRVPPPFPRHPPKRWPQPRASGE